LEDDNAATHRGSSEEIYMLKGPTIAYHDALHVKGAGENDQCHKKYLYRRETSNFKSPRNQTCIDVESGVFLGTFGLWWTPVFLFSVFMC
jgi:hypothetical protein